MSIRLADPAIAITRFSPRQAAFWHALEQKRFFKLIAGGSLTELEKLRFLTRVFQAAKADCIDIAPLPEVVTAVSSALSPDIAAPLIMVSIPLDPDPHFRKIELKTPDCITCGLCIPICPTETFSLNETLSVQDELCYGCGRCIPVCPTQALRLHPFLVQETLFEVLANPIVEAVELHTQFADPVMLHTFLNNYSAYLENKLIAYCFRPDQAKTDFWIESLHILNAFAPGRVLLQIDGAPMSGNDAREASIPAIQAATQAQQILQNISQLHSLPVTISGGINQHTPHLLQASENHFIAGAGVGTIARKSVWHYQHDEITAIKIATKLASSFQSRD